jgi:hypothetical protein
MSLSLKKEKKEKEKRISLVVYTWNSIHNSNINTENIVMRFYLSKIWKTPL